MMKKWDVVIVGSGISSLTCAALLAKKGKSVCVLEGYNKPGGYMHCFSRFGQRFDTGAHYVGAMDEGQPFRVLLKYLDVFDENHFIPLDPDAFDEFHFPGGKISFPKGYDNVVRELSARFPEDREAIATYFAMIRKVVLRFPTYEFNPASDIEVPIEALETSLATVVGRLTSNPRLQCVLYSYCALHGVMPEDIPFGFHAIVTDSLIRGPHGLAQGGDALAEKFVERIEKSGGQVLLKRRVTSLVTDGKFITEVVTDTGERFAADWVIAGIHPKAVFRLISNHDAFTPAFKSRVINLKESPAMFGVYASVNVEAPLNPLRNYYYFDSQDPKSFLASEKRSGTASAVFATCGSRVRAPGQTAFPVSFHSAAPIEWFGDWRDTRFGKRPEDYKALKKGLATGVLDLVEQYHPGLKASVNQYVTSTPLTNLHFNGSEDGSPYGIYHSMQNTGARALGPRTKILNLLLTGQNYLFPGLLGAAVSALRTSGHLIGIKPVLHDLHQELRGHV